ncbi:MAG: hypothetical protein CVU43_19860 [Chloroflexi bacterium HGW-Chloroflexi-5]|nr:MAG: hypothetical protein CVU43_19860 [Chloroflexi bacterium HGW-Chloroflexi-5]
MDVYQPDQGIFVSSETNDNDLNLSNAVARLGLKQIQHRLPQWAAVRREELILGRKVRQHKKRAIELLPLHLFTINWADSGPGFSWPDAYHLIWFPLFNRFVVTASQDSSDAYGVEDKAIEWRPDDQDRREAAKSIIVSYWRDTIYGWDQERWAYLFNEGLISDEEANAWADEAWPESVSVEEDAGD